MNNNEAVRMGKVEKQLKKATSVQELRVPGIMIGLKPAPQDIERSPAEKFDALRKRLREQLAVTHMEQMKQTRKRAPGSDGLALADA